MEQFLDMEAITGQEVSAIYIITSLHTQYSHIFIVHILAHNYILNKALKIYILKLKTRLRTFIYIYLVVTILSLFNIFLIIYFNYSIDNYLLWII